MHKKSSDTAIIAIYFATMLVIHFITSIVFQLWPVPIKPTIVHLPVIIASILYGPKIGAYLGGLMGVISLVTNTIILLPTSYLFSPFVAGGNLASIIIAFVPRILIGVVPFYVYRIFHNKFGLALAGALGSITNTIFVISGIFIFFSSLYRGDVKLMLASIVQANAIVEMLICATIVILTVPRLQKLQKKIT